MISPKTGTHDRSNSEYAKTAPNFRCSSCNITFACDYQLNAHLLHHIKQPKVQLNRVLEPIKITLKCKDKETSSFEVVTSPKTYNLNSPPFKSILAEDDRFQTDEPETAREEPQEDEEKIKVAPKVEAVVENSREDVEESEEPHEPDIRFTTSFTGDGDEDGEEDEAKPGSIEGDEANFEPIEYNEVNMEENGDEDVGNIEEINQNDDATNLNDNNTVTESVEEINRNEGISNHDDDMKSSEYDDEKEDATSDYGSEATSGAEATPLPESSPDYPKIRIKSGLLKETVTITEITDEDHLEGNANSNNHLNNGSMTREKGWNSPSLEDPLSLSESNNPSDGSLISSLISNNYDRAKDLGFTTSDSEFISIDRFEDRSRALQVFNTSGATSANSQNPLNTLAGLPMQQLAEQVSRLQPNNAGMHQQNVLINIQQFQQPPQPQHPYQPPPMYPHPPGVPPQPMYHHPQYPQYQPPNPMYYPPAPGYPPHMPPPPPRSQMPQQMPQQMSQQPPQQLPPPYRTANPRQPMQPRPQQMQQQVRGTQSVRVMGPRGPMGPRLRAPVRGGGIGSRGGGPFRQIRPRMAGPSTNGQQQQQHQHQPIQNQGPRMPKRSSEQMAAMQQTAAKRKRIDMLVPDKHDDPDCEVIAVQPKNTGLPQIQSIQGNASEPNDSNVMHLSDSITLSVRNPPVRPASPKKSDAKAVANILATRGITVTAAPKPKKPESPINKKPTTPPPPVAINLNSSVSILPAHKPPQKPSPNSNSSGSKLPTVDLTDDSLPEPNPPPPPPQLQKPVQKQNPQAQKVLPFQCDLCPAKYPNLISLNKHRQGFHKTAGFPEFGIPLIDLRQPGIMQKLTSFGIYNYIPLPGAANDTTFAVPVISANNRNVANNLGNIGLNSVLNLGPIRALLKPHQQNNQHHPHQNHQNHQKHNANHVNHTK